MGGPSASTVALQNQLTQSQIATQQQANQIAAQKEQQSTAAEQPAINYYSALSSGDPNSVMQAIAPQLAGVTQSAAANKENIYEQVGPGATRDAALTQNILNTGNATAGLRSNAISSSYDKLANIGAGLGSFSLQELGAGINAGQAASSSNQAVMTAQEQSKASTLGFLGELAGAGASLGSAAILGCWIAESIYGVDDIRTLLVRAWLNGPFKQTWFGSRVMRFYLRHGQAIAAFLNRYPPFKVFFRPLFEMALYRSVRDNRIVINANSR